MLHFIEQFFLDGLAKVMFMQSQYRKERAGIVRRHTEHTITIDGKTKRRTREKRRIKAPVLTYNKWEPPSENSQVSAGHCSQSTVKMLWL